MDFVSPPLFTSDDVVAAARTQASAGRTVVVCLCADWCGTCRSYRTDFTTLAERYPEHAFVWLDVEDDADLAGDIDIETFPTVMVMQGESLLFGGVLLPHIHHLDRLLGTLGDRAALPENEFSPLARRLLGGGSDQGL